MFFLLVFRITDCTRNYIRVGILAILTAVFFSLVFLGTSKAGAMTQTKPNHVDSGPLLCNRKVVFHHHQSEADLALVYREGNHMYAGANQTSWGLHDEYGSPGVRNLELAYMYISLHDKVRQI